MSEENLRGRERASACRIDANATNADQRGAIRRGGHVVAWVWGVNLLGEAFDPHAFDRDREVADDGTPVVIRSGWVEDGSRPAWMPASRGRFRERCEALEALGGEWWIWPRWNHVLSDVPSVQTFFRERSAEKTRWGLVLDVMGLLSDEMRGGAAMDHVERIVTSLGTHPALRGVILPGEGVMSGAQDPLMREIRERLFLEVTGDVAWIEATGA